MIFNIHSLFSLAIRYYPAGLVRDGSLVSTRSLIAPFAYLVATFRNELLRASSRSARAVFLDVRVDELLGSCSSDTGIAGSVAGAPVFLELSAATTFDQSSVVIAPAALALLESTLYCESSHSHSHSPHQEGQKLQQWASLERLIIPSTAVHAIPQLLRQLEARAKSAPEGAPLIGFACCPVARLGESLSARLGAASKAAAEPPSEHQQQQTQRSFDDDLRERERLLGCGRELTRALALQHQLVVLWPSDPSNEQSAVQSAALLGALTSLGLRLLPSATTNSPAACAAAAASSAEVALGLGVQLVFTHRFQLPCAHKQHISDASSSSYPLTGCCDREAADAAVMELGAVHTTTTDGRRTFGCLLVQLDPLVLHLLGIEDARLLPLFERVTLNEDADASAELPFLSSVRSSSSATSASLASAGDGDNRPLLENLTPLRCGFCSAAQSDTGELRSQFQFSHLVSLRAALTSTSTSSTRSPDANENANGIEKGNGNGNGSEEDMEPEALTELSVRASRLALPFCSCSVVRQMTLGARVERFEQEWWVRRGEALACWRTHLLLAIEALCSCSSAAFSVPMLTSFRVSNVFLPEPYPDARPDLVNNKLSLGIELCFRAGAREHALHFLALVANHCARLFHLVIR